MTYKKLPDEGVVVAYGEVTGHTHRVLAERGADVEIAKDSRGYYLKVNSGEAKIVHQEHAEIKIQKGIYYIGLQYEYDEIAEMRKVMD